MSSAMRGRPKSGQQKLVTASLNPRQFQALEALCAQMHATRNGIIKAAIGEFMEKYGGLTDDNPTLKHVIPTVRPTLNNERLNRLDGRIAAIETAVFGLNQAVELEITETLKSDLNSRTMSAEFLQVRDRREAEARGNTFVETAAGSGRGRRARFAPGSLATQSEGNGDWRKPQDVDATEPKSSTTARVGKKDE